MLEVAPQVGFVPPPSIDREQAIDFLKRRVRQVDLVTQESHIAKKEGYLPRPSIIGQHGRYITDEQADALLVNESTNMQFEIVRFPQAFIERMKRRIPPRKGQPLGDVKQYRTLSYDLHKQGIVLRGVPLECRVDLPGRGKTGSVDTSYLTPQGRPAKVGWHFDNARDGTPVEYIIANGSAADEEVADKEFGFVTGVGRAAMGKTHQEVAQYVTDSREAFYVGGPPPIRGFSVRLRPCEAILRVRPRELLHDAVPNFIGSTTIMLSMDPSMPLHQFGEAPWNDPRDTNGTARMDYVQAVPSL